MSQPRISSSTTFYLLRSYLALVLGILAIAFVLDVLLVRFGPAAAAPQDSPVSFTLIQAWLEEEHARGLPLEKAFLRRQAEWEAMLGLPLQLYWRADFEALAAFDADLDRGELVALYDGEGRQILYGRLGRDAILAMGPLPRSGSSAALIERLAMLSYYLLIAFLLFLWLRPFYRDLSALKAAAGRFGANDFSSRVHVSPRSGIWPVAHAFNAMAERIGSLISAHRDLTHAVSHELRTPLARMKFGLENLAASEDKDKRVAYLNGMRRDLGELDDLVDELLSYARLSEDNLALESEDLLLRPWLQAQLAAYEDQPLQVQLSCPRNGLGLVRCNPPLMARALHNVIRNGLRYASSDIVVSARRQGQSVEIRVCDDGPGIPPDLMDRLFEPFSRLESSRDRRSGGYGLGLAIARRILERHGGKIFVENAQPTGACFILRWPA